MFEASGHFIWHLLTDIHMRAITMDFGWKPYPLKVEKRD